ncbi:cytochrome c oxidase subunit II [Rhodobacter sp.]
MRLSTYLKGMGAAALAATTCSGAALAQGLEVVGQPHDKGIAFQPAATSLAVEQQWLDHMVLYIITAVVIFVCGLLLYVILRFNSRANPVPRKFTHNTPLEVAWTLVPIVVLVFLGFFSLPILFNQQEFPDGDVVIKVTGNQWYWHYEYVNDDISFDSYMIGGIPLDGNNTLTPEVEKQLADAGYSRDQWLLATDTAVVVPVGKIVLMQITAADVIHSWKVPAFAVMQDAVPGRLAQAWFRADREGIYFGQCSELCGKDHAFMPITVKVVSEEAYAKWVEQAKGGNVILTSEAAQAGSAVQVATAD